MGFCNRREARTDLKCNGNEPSESDKLIIDVIGLIRMSILSFTKLISIGYKSDDLLRSSSARWRTSSLVARVTFCKTFLVSGGFNSFGYEPVSSLFKCDELLSIDSELAL